MTIGLREMKQQQVYPDSKETSKEKFEAITDLVSEPPSLSDQK